MSNLVAFNSVFERAIRAQDTAQSLIESPTIRVPTAVIVFAKDHINALEEQLVAAYAKIAELEKLHETEF